MLSSCIALTAEKKCEENSMNIKDVAKIILQIKDKILKEPQIILSLHYSSSQKIIELMDKDA